MVRGPGGTLSALFACSYRYRYSIAFLCVLLLSLDAAHQRCLTLRPSFRCLNLRLPLNPVHNESMFRRALASTTSSFLSLPQNKNSHSGRTAPKLHPSEFQSTLANVEIWQNLRIHSRASSLACPTRSSRGIPPIASHSVSSTCHLILRKSRV